jgi:tetratricopeptide (TPR) repeat protein
MSFLDGILGRRVSRAYRDGMHAFNACRFEEALELFRRSLEAGGSRGDPVLGLSRFYAAEAATHLGRTCLQDADPEQALRWLELAQNWNPRHPTLLYLAALAYAERGSREASISCLTVLEALDPEHREARLLRAALLHASGAHREAESELQQLRRAGGSLSRVLLRVLDPYGPEHPHLAQLLRELAPDRESIGV